MRITYFIFVISWLAGCSQVSKLKEFNLSNPSDFDRKEVVRLDVSSIDLEDLATISLVDDQGQEVLIEGLDLHNDGKTDMLLALVQVAADQEQTFTLTNTGNPRKVKKLTQTEISVKEGGKWEDRKYVGGSFQNVSRLRVPDQHTDHSYYIRYEGPGWESDLVGYRFYLDWRNGIDIFGKRTNALVLQQVGQDGFDSYHELSDWGMDVLKVGNSLGLGSIGRHVDDSLYRFQEVDSVYCKIKKNGLLESVISTTYYNWKTGRESTRLVSNLSIQAGSRVTMHDIKLSNPLPGFCTGLVKNENEQFIDLKAGDYRLLGTYGDFSLNNDKLGMAIIVKNDQVDQVFDDGYSHVVTFKPVNEITYYLLAAWELEPDGIKTFADFERYAKQEISRLNQPIVVNVED